MANSVPAAAKSNLSSAIDWMRQTSKSVAASIGQTAKNVWSAVSSFFSSVASTIGYYLTRAKDATLFGLGYMKGRISALPTSVKVGALLVAAGAAGYAAYRYFTKTEETKAEPAPAVTATTVPASEAPAVVV